MRTKTGTFSSFLFPFLFFVTLLSVSLLFCLHCTFQGRPIMRSHYRCRRRWLLLPFPLLPPPPPKTASDDNGELILFLSPFPLSSEFPGNCWLAFLFFIWEAVKTTHLNLCFFSLSLFFLVLFSLSFPHALFSALIFVCALVLVQQIWCKTTASRSRLEQPCLVRIQLTIREERSEGNASEVNASVLELKWWWSVCLFICSSVLFCPSHCMGQISCAY